jgi:hypothetical protein
VGLGPLPLPFRFRFRTGPAIEPPAGEADAPAFKEEVRAAVEELLHVVPAIDVAAASRAVAALR